MFIGREKELKSLNNLYASDKFEFGEGGAYEIRYYFSYSIR